jgi:serine/threonine-protein kinase
MSTFSRDAAAFRAGQPGEQYVGRFEVAVKMIRGGLESASERARFRAEAEAAAKLTHPGIAGVYEFGETGGVLYLTLEFCDAGPLSHKLDPGRG